MNGYKIVDIEKLEEHITFIRIDPTNIELTLKEVMISLSDLSWISRFDLGYLEKSFHHRAEQSIKYIATNIIKSADDNVTKDSGEYIVSELARKAVVEQLKYLDIPLAELIKEKAIGNHGFDFYSRNLNEILLFGEAKYIASSNAYGSAFSQIIDFATNGQDLDDLPDIDKFCCDNSKKNFLSGSKGFIAAFASKNTGTLRLINGIKKNKDFITASGFDELICIAVNI
jgi:hypothetical protein